LYNWYQAIGDVAATVLEHPDDHAGEMETSVGLAYFADLVARDDNGQLLADDGIKRPSRFEAINRGWVSISRPWHLLTTNSGAGNPHRATADKGRRIVEAASERLAAFLIELAASPLDESFPF
jgi:creatinine amidohydrolase